MPPAQPIADVWVHFQHINPDNTLAEGAGPTSRAAKTGRDGTFRSAPLQAGRYQATVNRQQEISVFDPADDPFPAASGPVFFELSTEGPQKPIEIRVAPKLATGADATDGAGQGASAEQAAADETMMRTVVDGETGKPLAGVHVTVEHCDQSGRGPQSDGDDETDDRQGRPLRDQASGCRVGGAEPGAVGDGRRARLCPAVADRIRREPFAGSRQARQLREHGLPSRFNPDEPFPGADVDRVYPGEEVTGTIVDPQGKPVAGLPVYVTSLRDLKPKKSEEDAKKALKSGQSVITSFQTPLRTVVQTDCARPLSLQYRQTGDCRVYGVEPAGYAALSRSIGQRRGDIGKTVLEPGVRVQGRVVDVEGKPVPNVWVRLGSANSPPAGWHLRSHLAQRRRPIAMAAFSWSRCMRASCWPASAPPPRGLA